MLEAMQASSECAPAAARTCLHLDMDLRRNGGAVDENLAGGVHQQVIALPP